MDCRLSAIDLARCDSQREWGVFKSTEKNPGATRVQLSVQAVQRREKAGGVQRTDPLVSLSTVGETPAGHEVVLCVTPASEESSTFVVQAMP